MRMNYYSYDRQGGFGAFPPVVKNLLILNALMFVGQAFGGYWLQISFALWPLGSGFQPWQLVSYGFLHGGLWHLVFNMFALWMFGRQIEYDLGSKRFLTYYLVCIVGAGVVQLATAMATGAVYSTIGASGAVFGILLAYGLMHPNEMIMMVFPPIPMKAKYFVIFFGAIELVAFASGSQPGIANAAHLGGMLFGYLLLRHWRNSAYRQSDY